jgi:hypothetical protein
MAREKAVRTPRAPQLRLVVTQKFIDDAIPKHSGHCMIADALKVAIPDGRMHAVDLQTIRVTDQKRHLRYTYLTPRIAQEALVRWDVGIKPAPFSFVLRNGQVTRAGSSRKETDPKKLEQRRRAAAKMLAVNKARLKTREGAGPRGGKIPDRIGGKTPPLVRDKQGIPMSQRREFGIRALVIDG